jgi:hypothetical protein
MGGELSHCMRFAGPRVLARRGNQLLGGWGIEAAGLLNEWYVLMGPEAGHAVDNKK